MWFHCLAFLSKKKKACVDVVLANLSHSPSSSVQVKLVHHHLLPPSLQRRERNQQNQVQRRQRPQGVSKKKKGLVTPNSPAMCTRSKTPESPAMGTRSKRKILDWISRYGGLFCWFCKLHVSCICFVLGLKLKLLLCIRIVASLLLELWLRWWRTNTHLILLVSTTVMLFLVL